MSWARQVVMLAAAVCATLLLHGCGGSDSSGDPCVGKVFKLVSQRIEGSSQVDLTVTQPEQIKETIKAEQTVMLDLEKVNMYQSVKTQISIPRNGTKEEMQLETKAIFNAEKKEFVFYMKQEGKSLPPLSECKVMDLVTVLPSPDLLSKLIATVLLKLQQNVKCTAVDGPNTVFNYSLAFPDPSMPLPVPLPPGTKVQVSVSGTYEMDKDNLLRSADVKEEAQTTFNNITADNTAKANFLVKSAQSGGPTEKDLDYSSWGNCSKISPDSEEFGMVDLQQILTQSNDFVFHELVFAQALAASPLHRLVSLAIQESLQSASIEVV